MNNDLRLKAIGVIHSPYTDPKDAPRQGRMAAETSIIEIFPQYQAGLTGLDNISHLIVLYWCDRVDRKALQTVTPFGPEEKGVFACRSPMRPNPIAFCIAKILERKGNALLVQGLDALDSSPLLDLKPYSSSLDSIENVSLPWNTGLFG